LNDDKDKNDQQRIIDDSQPTVPTPVPPPGTRSEDPFPTADTAEVSAPRLDARTLAEGTIIADRYRIQGVLGVGGMGVVYRALDQTLGVEIALKILRPEVDKDGEFLERFRNELRVARQVTHRNVVRLHDIGEYGGLYYMTMDLVTGISLQKLLSDRGQLPLEEAIRILTQIAHALAEAHRQDVVHRDLKPANILLHGESNEAYVSDFGIARSLSAPGLTKTGVVVGTPYYLSPEQARGEKASPASDIYSLGVIFVEMLSGKLPFAGGTLLEILSARVSGHRKSLDELGVKVDTAIAAVIDRCLAPEPKARYASAAELVEDLENLERPAQRLRQQRRQRLLRGAGWVAAAALVAALGVIGYLRFAPQLLHPSSTSAATAGPTKPRYAVAVLPFRPPTGREDLAWASTGLAEMLSSSLAESEGVRVVEGLRVMQVVEDLGLEPGLIRDEQLQQLAQVLEVNRVVDGRLQAAGDSIQLQTRVVELDTPGSPARQLEALTGTTTTLFDMVGTLSDQLRNALDLPALELETAPLTASSRAMEAYTRGLELLSRGETLKAAPELEEAVAVDRNFAAAWVRVAKSYEALGRDGDALDAAREAVRASPSTTSRVSFEARASEALLRGDPEAAQQFLGELVKRYPNDTEAQIALAQAYGQQGRFTEAVENLTRCVEIDPSQPRAWYLLGRFSIQSGDSQRAVDEYLVKALIQQKTLKNEQGEAEVHNAFGVGYQRLNMLDEAAASYSTAASIRKRIGDKGGLATSLQNLAVIETTRGEHEAAQANLETALAIHTELGNRAGIAETHNALGVLEEGRGRYAEALDEYKQALQERKELGDEYGLAESHTNVGYVYYLLGEYDNALLFQEKALALYRKNEDQWGIMVTLQTIGFCQRVQGQWVEASTSFLEALDLSRAIDAPTATAVCQGNLGILAQHQGRYQAALDSYRAALATLEQVGDVQGQVEYLLHESSTLLELGASGDATLVLDRVVERQQEGANLEDLAKLAQLRGRALLLDGDAAGAAKEFAAGLEQAQRSNSAVALVQAQIDEGIHRLASGRAAQARRILRQAHAQAQGLGHAELKLRSAEALARAELRGGSTSKAEEALRQALRLAEGPATNGYAGTYRLRLLLAEVLRQQGNNDGATREFRDAAAALQRVRTEVPEPLLAHFDDLPGVHELLTIAAAHSTTG